MGCTSSFEEHSNEPFELTISSNATTTMLDPSHCFSFASVLRELKGMPSVTVNGIEYGLMHTGGFVRISTDLCRSYFLAQNTYGHTTPDWKFHISIAISELPKAWDIIAYLFIHSGCLTGMKMCLNNVENPFGHWSERQYGREITIYIFRYDDHYHEFNQTIEPEFQVTRALKQKMKSFWLPLISRIEEVLNAYQIATNGLADGDYPLNKYVSIRNEAFVKVEGLTELQYPPNDRGFNAANHKVPLKLPPIIIEEKS